MFMAADPGELDGCSRATQVLGSISVGSQLHPSGIGQRMKELGLDDMCAYVPISTQSGSECNR